MKQFTRFAVGTLMLAGLFVAAVAPAPATDAVAFTDGTSPTPWCKPSDKTCTGS